MSIYKLVFKSCYENNLNRIISIFENLNNNTKELILQKVFKFAIENNSINVLDFLLNNRDILFREILIEEDFYFTSLNSLIKLCIEEFCQQNNLNLVKRLLEVTLRENKSLVLEDLLFASTSYLSDYKIIEFLLINKANPNWSSPHNKRKEVIEDGDSCGNYLHYMSYMQGFYHDQFLEGGINYESFLKIKDNISKIILLLINYGANINQSDDLGYTPLDCMFRVINPKAESILKNFGAKHSKLFIEKEYKIEVETSIFYGHYIETNIAKYWLDQWQLNFHNEIKKDIELYEMGINNECDLFFLDEWINNKKDINRLDTNGKTSLDIALDIGHNLVAEKIRENGGKTSSELESLRSHSKIQN